MGKHRLILLAAAVSLSASVLAQSEGGLLLGAEAEKKINRQLSVSLEADFRSRNDFKTLDRWGIGVGASYKLTKGLKADVSYKLLDYNYREKVESYTSAKGNDKIKWRPSYYGLKHRFSASVTGSRKLVDDFKVSLRERWQYTYRPETSPERYKLSLKDQTMKLDDNYVRDAKGKHQLRSRLQVEYDRKRALLTPYANAEFYNSWALEKVRYCVGTEIRIDRQHSLDIYYRFQDMHNVDADEYDPDMHFVGVGYKFKF